MKIIYIGPLWQGSTCLQRMRSLQSAGQQIIPVDTLPAELRGLHNNLVWRIANRLYKGYDWAHTNSTILDLARCHHDADVLWLDKALTVRPRTLISVRRLIPKMVVVGYSPDDMSGPHNQTARFLSSLAYYDVYFTTKTYGVTELKALGCKDVRFVGNGYDPDTHRPCQIAEEDKLLLGGGVGFIGDYERERADSIRFLADNGVNLRVWGPNWHKMPPHRNVIIEGRPLWGDDYVKAICSFDINLCFLRKINRDMQTQRTMEIPACEAFMLAERTAEHSGLFEEDKEAVFFSNNNELLRKCQYYLAHKTERERIALSGRRRCLDSGYDNPSIIASMLAVVEKLVCNPDWRVSKR